MRAFNGNGPGGLLPRYLVAADPDLVQVSLPGRLPEREIWLIIRRDLRNVARVRAVAEYLVEVCRRDQRLLRHGTKPP